MKALLLFVLFAPSAFAIESGSTTLRCDDASGDVNGIYISYGLDWMNDGSSTSVLDLSGWGTQGARFVVQTVQPSDSRAFPAGVTADVSLEAPSASKENKVNIAWKGEQYDIVLTVRTQDIHRDSYKGGPGDDFRATYSFPAEAVLTDKGDGGMNAPDRRKMKCRASSGMHGMAG